MPTGEMSYTPPKRLPEAKVAFSSNLAALDIPSGMAFKVVLPLAGKDRHTKCSKISLLLLVPAHDVVKHHVVVPLAIEGGQAGS